jgi:hypothetical protein
MTASPAPSPQPPHGLAVSRFVDNVRRSPLKVKSRRDPLPHQFWLLGLAPSLVPNSFFFNVEVSDFRQSRRLEICEPLKADDHREPPKGGFYLNMPN